MAETVVIAEGAENTGYRFSWGLAIAGGVAAAVVTFFLLTLGSGFGLLLVNPQTHAGPSLPSFLTGGAIYFIAAQAFGFAVGGHLAGRLLGPIVESRAQEEFRAEAHGFIAWAVAVLATVTMVGLAGLTVASTGAATAALYGVSPAKTETTPSTYIVDVLFRPAAGGVPADVAANIAARAEAGRIVDAGIGLGQPAAPADRARLVDLVSSQAGIAPHDAATRVDRMQAEITTKVERAANYARKAASYTALWLALSLVFGAIVSITAAMAARDEDDRQAVQ
ncbi:MAG: hypothetical protein WDN01_20240 [Rhizomicrobium sp.]